MRKYLFTIMIIFGFISCNDKTDWGVPTTPVEENYSHIPDPEQRWRSYKLEDYYIEQSWSCECLPPNFCSAYIINDTVEDVKYEISKDDYYGRSNAEIYDQTKNVAITVSEAFELINSYKSSAHKIDVEYHPRFGYPVKIFIDKDSLMADDEIRRSFANLQKIEK